MLSSKVRLSRLDHTRPSWMRTASGTEKTLLAACTSKPTACMECPMMYSGLVLVRLLMQELYGRHFLAALGSFDAVPDQDQPAIDRYEAWEQLQHSLRPQGRKPVELDAAAVKVIQQLGVEPGPQVQGAHDAGDAEQFHPHRRPATAVTNHMKVRRRENAGRRRRIAFHQMPHSESGCSRSGMVVSMD